MAYQPGKGISKGALERLRARKCAEAGGIADVPAEDRNDQWDRLLGEGAKKKLRCGICTRPLSEQEQLDRSLVCGLCALRSRPALAAERAALASEEFGLDVLFYLSRAASAAPAPPPAASCGSEAGAAGARAAARRPAAEEAGREASSSGSRGGATAARELLPEIARGSAIRESCSVQAGRQPIGVVSFNLLADCFVRVEGQPWNAFAFCDDAHLAWEGRMPRILEMLRKSDADVVCLQEVVLERRCAAGKAVEEWATPSWLDGLEGYVSVLQDFKQKEWEKAAQRNGRVVGREVPTGLVTLYRAELFEEYADSKHGSGSGTTVFLRRRASVSEGVLELAVANIHLLGDPSRASEHLKSLSSLKKNMGKSPVRIVCGDFNDECAAGSDIGEWFAQEGFTEAPTGTSWAEPGKALRLDHVFFAGRLRLEATTVPLLDSEVCSGLPCASCPSDHAPVGVLFSGEAQRTKCPW